MDNFKKWYLSGNFKDLRGRFNKLQSVKQKSNDYEVKLGTTSYPWYNSSSASYHMLVAYIRRIL